MIMPSTAGRTHRGGRPRVSAKGQNRTEVLHKTAIFHLKRGKGPACRNPLQWKLDILLELVWDCLHRLFEGSHRQTLSFTKPVGPVSLRHCAYLFGGWNHSAVLDGIEHLPV